MANRHAHKKLRAEIRARMTETGESYQAARRRVLARSRQQAGAVDLVPFTYFGLPVTLATREAGLFNTVTVLRHAPASALPWMTWLRPKGVN